MMIKTFDSNDLGFIYTNEAAEFRVWAPTAKKVTLNLYRTGSDCEPDAGSLGRTAMERVKDGVWYTRMAGDWKGVYYTFTVESDGTSRETADVYAKACGINGARSMVVDLTGTDPEHFLENAEWRSARHVLAACPVLYELHIKDFSGDRYSGISRAYQGKYLAFTEKNTTLGQKGEHPTGIAYLKKLGITHVHLLPFFDYGSVDEGGDLDIQFNWGYDPVNYNVPEGSYSTDPYHGEVRIRECKQMIQSLHEEGIGVVMDVVYNHTFSTDSVFERTVPGYYYRKQEDGTFVNGSLCGNDTASEQEMFRRYMIDSVCYWAEEYQIDGFRFDLMGLHDVETMNRIREALNELPKGEDILMYGEPWAGDYSPMKEGAVPAVKAHIDKLSEGIAIFCDNTRDTIKGDVFIADEPGFVNGETGLEEAVMDSVCAWCRKKQGELPVTRPSQIISYVSAHDNYTLWDKLNYTLPSNAGKRRRDIDFAAKDTQVLRQNKMAAALYFTCLGTVFFQAGEEFGRTKQGLGDSFNAPAVLNALSWKRSRQFAELVEFYRGLILFRKEWQEFYGRNAGEVKVDFQDMDTLGTVAFLMSKQRSDKSLLVIYNQNQEKMVWMLPEGLWKIICDGKSVSGVPEERSLVSGKIIIENQAVMILEKGV